MPVAVGWVESPKGAATQCSGDLAYVVRQDLGVVVVEDPVASPEVEESPTPVAVPEHDRNNVTDVIVTEQFSPHEAAVEAPTRDVMKSCDRCGLAGPTIDICGVLEPDQPG